MVQVEHKTSGVTVAVCARIPVYPLALAMCVTEILPNKKVCLLDYSTYFQTGYYTDVYHPNVETLVNDQYLQKLENYLVPLKGFNVHVLLGPPRPEETPGGNKSLHLRYRKEILTEAQNVFDYVFTYHNLNTLQLELLTANRFVAFGTRKDVSLTLNVLKTVAPTYQLLGVPTPEPQTFDGVKSVDMAEAVSGVEILPIPNVFDHISKMRSITPLDLMNIPATRQHMKNALFSLTPCEKFTPYEEEIFVKPWVQFVNKFKS